MTRLNEVFPETKVYVKLMSFYSPNQIYSLIDRVFPFLFFLLFITMPFAKTISGPVYVTCIILFVVQILSRREYQTEAKQYYVAVLFYLAVIGLSMIYTPDVLECLGFFKQQCIVLIGVILIEKVSSSEAVRRYLYSFIAGGSILALISLFQGLHLNVTRPPTIWYSVHGGNLLLMSLAVTTALLVSESSTILRIVNFTLFFVQAGALYLNGTRGAWVALLIIMVALPFLHARFNIKGKILYLLFLSVIGVMACKGNYFQEKLNEAQNDIIAYHSDNSKTSLGYRFELWHASSQMFLDNPVLGVGAGGWEKELEKMIGQKKAPAYLLQFNQTHNIYLDALSTRGLIGLLTLLALTCSPLLYVRKRLEPESALFRNVLIFVTIAFLVSGLTDTLVQIRFVFMAYIALTGLSLSVLVRKKNQNSCLTISHKYALRGTCEKSVDN